MKKQPTLCPGPRCRQHLKPKRDFCPWHWKILPDEMRVALLSARAGPERAAAKFDAIKFLQGVQNEKDRQRENEKVPQTTATASAPADAGTAMGA